MDARLALATAEKLHRRLTNRRPKIQEFDDYYEGNQPLTFASEEWAEWHKGRYKGFADNWCGVVANSPAERLEVLGVRTEDRRGSLLSSWDDWLSNEGELQSSQGFLESIIATTSYAIVWGNKHDEPVMTWEHPSDVIVSRDPFTRRATAGVKSTVYDGFEYLTLYAPDALWKWRRVYSDGETTSSGYRTETGLYVESWSNARETHWEPYRPDGDDVWPVPNPLGEVPIVEFPNRPRLRRDPVSDIAGTKAMQDAVNLLWAYLFTSADHASFPARVVLGQESPKMPVLDKDGQKIGEKNVDMQELSHGRFLWLTNPTAKIDSWEAARLDVFTAVIEKGVGHIAAQTRTPQHYFMNKDNIPATGYEAAEAGLTNKVVDQQRYFGAGIREVMRLFALVRDDRKAAAAARSAFVQWKNPGVRSEAQLADALQKRKDVGYPFEYLLELDGHGPDEIARIMELKRKEADDPVLAEIANVYREL